MISVSQRTTTDKQADNDLISGIRRSRKTSAKISQCSIKLKSIVMRMIAILKVLTTKSTKSTTASMNTTSITAPDKLRTEASTSSTDSFSTDNSTNYRLELAENESVYDDSV